MTIERTFKRTLGNQPLFFELVNFDIDKNQFEMIRYKNYDYVRFECLFIKNKSIKQDVNGYLLLTPKGTLALIKEYKDYNGSKVNPKFYGYYDKNKLPLIRHISKQE